MTLEQRRKNLDRIARLRDAEVVEKLFSDLGSRFRARPGGYTRILRMMPRPGDSADMALMQLVDRPAPAGVETAPADAEGGAKKKRAKKKTEAAVSSDKDDAVGAPKRSRKKKAAAA